MNWYLSCLKEHYADFKGRARRKEYWMFALFNFIASSVLSLLGTLIGCEWIVYLYALAVFVPSLAVLVRRLHDTGRTGFWFFICFVPLIGFIWLLVLMCIDSQPEANNWGENPKKA